MSTVYVSQIPQKFDKEQGVLIPTVDVSPASKHGDLHVLAPSRIENNSIKEFARQTVLALSKYDFKRGDSILLIGDPVVISVVAATIGREFDRFRVLRWDKKNREYTSHEVIFK